QNGDVAAMEDRCSHRNVPLSLGRRIEDRIKCPYPGLEFAHTGRCATMPGLQGAPPEAFSIRRYPVVQRHGFVWIWPGEPARADESLIVDYSWHDDPAWTGKIFMRTIKAGYVFNLENLMDLSHVPYVHNATIAFDSFADAKVTTHVGDAHVDVRREMRNASSQSPLTRELGWTRVNTINTVRYRPPSNFQIHNITENADNPSERLEARFGAPSTPETASSHHHFMTAYRTYALGDAALTEQMADLVLRAFCEDEVLMTIQQDRLDRGAYRPEQLFHVDKGAAAAVRMLRKTIDEENKALNAA
ncbi:MAG: Rieske 2Fe-2S domain-containing protein, partial [Hyphomonadaceae bacterium]